MISYKAWLRLFPVILAVGLIGCASSPRFTTRSAPSSPAASSTAAPGDISLVQEGNASYYADEYNGKPTASGEKYDMNDLTAAHRTLPFNTKVRVTNLSNGKAVTVRINDRGPFKDDRLIDLSFAAAKIIDLILTGTAPVQLEVMELGSGGSAR